MTSDSHHDRDFERELRALVHRLAHNTHRLAEAVAAARGNYYHLPQEESDMAKKADAQSVLDALAAQIAANSSVVDSAIALIGGIKGEIDAAVQAALAGGATAAQLAPFTDLAAAMAAKDSALAAAVQANTPPVTPPTP